LLAEGGFSSKDHTATLCFLIRNYSEFSEEDINLYYDLAITQEEIQWLGPNVIQVGNIAIH